MWAKKKNRECLDTPDSVLKIFCASQNPQLLLLLVKSYDGYAAVKSSQNKI